MDSVSKGKVLIIDDSPKNIQVAVSILEQAGYECEFSLNGAGGLTWLESEPFDVILLDVMMPEEDGFEVCRNIKSNPGLKKIPVVFLTAKTDRESMIQGFEAGGEDYITKPFDARELIVRIRNQVELKRNRELLEKTNKDLELLVEEKTQKLVETNEQLTKTNQELRHFNQNLKVLEESKQHFLNMLGTEISGSLNEIIGILQVVKYKVDSKKVAQLIDRIDRSLSKIEISVGSALRITELQSKGEILSLERIEINKLIGFAVFKLDDKIRHKQFKIENYTNQEPIYINGESQLIMAALVNIIDFFLERNLTGAQLTIETQKEAQKTYIYFKDNGEYISDEDKAAIFDVFYTGTQSLHITKLIAQVHFGEVTLENRKLSKGVELSLELFTKEE